MRPSSSSRAAIVDGGVALLDDELDLGRVGRGRRRSARRPGPRARCRRRTAMSERRRIVRRPDEDGRVERPGAATVSDATRTTAAEDEGEDQELDEPDDAAAAAAVASPPLPRRRRAVGRLEVLGDVLGRRRRPARTVARAAARGSRGRPPERIVIGRSPWVGRVGTHGVGRVSSASCRMIAAASRSTRARYASRWVATRRSPGAAARHRPEALLGEVAGQALVLERPDRDRDRRHDRGARRRPRPA